MRKYTVITYLNDEIPTENQGQLRLFLDDKIVDIIPRFGRTILFKSEVVEHEVRPTKGYDRYAITTWFNRIQPPMVEDKKEEVNDGTIFVGIPAYRDPQLASTLKSMIEHAKNP